eukprot:500845_1
MATSTGASAHELRGSAAAGLTIFSTLQASCEDGMKDGQESMRYAWESSGADCSSAWNLQTGADKYKDIHYPENPPNPMDKSYNQCARMGVDHQVQLIEEERLHDSPDQCVALGTTAAEMIVFQNVCIPDWGSTTSVTDYKQECREVAYGVCRGQVPSKISQYCPDYSGSTSDLANLMDMCEDQVDDLSGGDEIESSE